MSVQLRHCAVPTMTAVVQMHASFGQPWSSSSVRVLILISGREEKGTYVERGDHRRACALALHRTHVSKDKEREGGGEGRAYLGGDIARVDSGSLARMQTQTKEVRERRRERHGGRARYIHQQHVSIHPSSFLLSLSETRKRTLGDEQDNSGGHQSRLHR